VLGEARVTSGKDETRKYREIDRELLLLEVGTVMFDADKLLHDQPLDLSIRTTGGACPPRSRHHVDRSALPRKEQPSWPDA
jgi:hypothetical protein